MDRPPRFTEDQPEPGFLVDGKPVRDMTDEELKRQQANIIGQVAIADQQFTQAWQTTCNLRVIVNVLAYEIDRRKHKLLIATGLPKH